VPPADVDVDAGMVRALLREQCPELSHLAVEPADTGWDNVMFRLGDRLAARLPRRTAAIRYQQTEHHWLPHLARRLTLPVPAPVRIGAPACGYPWAWSIVPWLDGVGADLAAADRSQVSALARFLEALHVEAPADAPHNPYRSVALSDRDSYVRERWHRLERRTDLVTGVIKEAWTAGVEAPIDVAPTWIHGDMHARNILVRDGVLTGVIDWGDAARGDRATDLASIWMVFDSDDLRREAIAACGAGSATLARSRAWAIYFATVFADAGLADDPRHARLGATIFRRVLEGP
jgi:aminoglycoside phosphotransferase (APT) family kinase protein